MFIVPRTYSPFFLMEGRHLRLAKLMSLRDIKIGQVHERNDGYAVEVTQYSIPRDLDVATTYLKGVLDIIVREF